MNIFTVPKVCDRIFDIAHTRRFAWVRDTIYEVLVTIYAL